MGNERVSTGTHHGWSPLDPPNTLSGRETHTPPEAWNAPGKLAVLGHGEPGKLLIKSLLLSGKSIQWVSEVLTILRNLTGDIWGFDYDKETPKPSTMPLWLRWRRRGCEFLMADILERLQKVERPGGSPQRGQPAGISLGRPMRNLRSKVVAAITGKVKRWRRGARRALSRSNGLGPAGTHLYVYPPGYEAVDDFTSRLRSWEELLASQPLITLFPTRDERSRILSQCALFEDPTDSAAMVKSVTVAPRNAMAGGGVLPFGVPFAPATSNPLDSIWRHNFENNRSRRQNTLFAICVSAWERTCLNSRMTHVH